MDVAIQVTSKLVFKANNMVRIEMGRTGSRASDLHGQQGGGSHDKQR